MTPDGIIGPATRAALAVPLTWRVRQVELALERLRWLPALGDGRGGGDDAHVIPAPPQRSVVFGTAACDFASGPVRGSRAA